MYSDEVNGYLIILNKFNNSFLRNKMSMVDFMMSKIKVFAETASAP